jgi:hypothetical protein
LFLSIVVVLTGCDRQVPPAIYAPHEVGLTLAYEDPQLPSHLRREQRRQVRVNRATPAPTGSLRVECAVSTLRGEESGTFLLEDGAVIQESPASPLLGDLLPKGFPDRNQAWSALGRRYKVLGRAMAVGLEVRLPEGFNRLGVWVESAPEEGGDPTTRTFFLPDLGRVETQEFRNGRWVCVNKLVDRGFTDAPYRRIF